MEEKCQPETHSAVNDDDVSNHLSEIQNVSDLNGKKKLVKTGKYDNLVEKWETSRERIIIQDIAHVHFILFFE